MCSLKCPTTLFGYLANMTCVDVCPNDFYGDLLAGNCVQRCPFSTFKHSESKKCESTCFSNFPYGDSTTNFCVKICPINSDTKKQLYGENSTLKCV